MEWDLPGVEVQEQEEASAEGERVEVEWGEHALELGPAGVVSAPVAGLDFLIKPVFPATT